MKEKGKMENCTQNDCRVLENNKEIIKMSLQIFFFFNTDIYNLLLWTIFIQITTVIFPLSHIPLITFSPVNKFPVFCLLVFLSFSSSGIPIKTFSHYPPHLLPCHLYFPSFSLFYLEATSWIMLSDLYSSSKIFLMGLICWKLHH